MSQLSLAQLQQLALSNNPRIRQANAEVDAARGHVLQAGLHPNPTVGYQVDQWQPNLKIPPGSTGSGVGQQGGFINQLIKTAGKLSLAQQVSGYDCINAMVAARKAEIAVMTQVRSAYFAVLVAQQSLETAATFAKLASDAYDVQIKRVAAGVAASHEPYQYHAQAILAQNAVTQAESARFVAWKHLAAALGQPDMPVATLVGRADVQAPTLDRELIQARMGENHTDLLTMRNQIAQAQANLTLQRRLLIPDLQTNTYHQYDNLAQTYQFGVQLGIQIPISDRNQGNIRTARAKLVSASEQLQVMEIELLNKLAEAHGRYETNRKLAISYREQVLPSLTQAYRGLVRQSQIEPEKASYSDITTARQNLYNTYQLYLGVLDAQWKALIDIAQLGQLDDLFLEPTSTK